MFSGPGVDLLMEITSQGNTYFIKVFLRTPLPPFFFHHPFPLQIRQRAFFLDSPILFEHRMLLPNKNLKKRGNQEIE